MARAIGEPGTGPGLSGSAAFAPGGRPGSSGIASAALIAAALSRSGSSPSIGAARATTLPAAGALTHPAVA